MSNEYFDAREYFVENLWFRHEGIAYRGSGVLRWNPEEGFRLVAQILGEAKRLKVEFRSVDVIKPLRIRMEILPRGNKIIALTSFLSITDSDLFFDQPFAINFKRTVFFHRRDPKYENDEKWFGSAVYEFDKIPTLPDPINKDIKVGNRPLGQSFSLSALDYLGDGGEHIFGEKKDEKYLEFHWSLPKSTWNKERNWRLAEAIQDSLSIVSGVVARLRFHESYRRHRVAHEFNASGESTLLGRFCRPFDFDFLPKELFSHLALFLSVPSENEFVIRKMLRQIADAANKNSQDTSGLLLSLVLEAALRTYFKLPFIPGLPSNKDHGKPDETLPRFQEDLLTGLYDDKWKDVTKKVLRAYKRLRHRNAHPDWLSTSQGMLSKDELAQSINDMIFLSRFYGFMILALSGKKNLEPKFPAPFSRWKPLMTMETAEQPADKSNG